MNIGSLFVELGVKGGKSSNNILKGVRSNLRDAALIANQTVSLFNQLYSGIRNLSEGSSKYATDLKIVSDNLDISTDRLQRWDYAAKLAGASGGEIFRSMQSLQKVLINFKDTGEAPKYFQMLFQEISKVDSAFDSNRFLNDIDYAMQELNKIASSGTIKDVARLNEAFQGLGFSPTMINFLKNYRGNLNSISKDLLITKEDISALDQVRKGWVEIDQTVQKTFTGVARLFDDKFLKSIKELVVSLGELVKALVAIAKEYKVVETAANLVKNTASNLNVLTQEDGVTDVIKGAAMTLGEKASVSNLNPLTYLGRFFDMLPAPQLTQNLNFNNADPKTVIPAVNEGIRRSELSNAYSQTGASGGL